MKVSSLSQLTFLVKCRLSNPHLDSLAGIMNAAKGGPSPSKPKRRKEEEDSDEESGTEEEADDTSDTNTDTEAED